MPNAVPFFGETLRLAPEVSEWSLMEWSEAAEDVDESSTAALASTMRLARECIDPADHARFRALGRKHKAGVESLLPIIAAAFEQATERPTLLPADSSAGQLPTSPNSEDDAYSRAMAAWSGRPDKQQFLVAALAARSA